MPRKPATPPPPPPALEGLLAKIPEGHRLDELCRMLGLDPAAMRAGQLTTMDWQRLILADLMAPNPNAPGMTIKWQEGTVKERGKNGLQVEEVLQRCVDRLQELNAALPCKENALAIDHLRTAIVWLNERTKKREQQGVEGSSRAHRS